MSTEEQKRLWREEKEQQKRDKLDQPREVRRRKVDLTFGGIKKKKPAPTSERTVPSTLPDDIMRKHLGI